ncbi:universal stress protein [Conexibacter sp. SYSU D00693]|uniref:universal stress protein n=1 Tax=Conexibacter sp. SYSU D00693 TaxID=2812560 RepID=UPI00196B5007|nr:universal stress protein [Conexibacter sp. SYSU D00693]
MTTQPPYRKVLVAVDGRPGGQDAVALARVLAAPDAELCLVHVWALGATLLVDRTEESDRLLERERRLAGLECPIRSFGSPTTLVGLRELVRTERADLVVLGASHRSPLGRLVLGSVTRSAVHKLGCAVAVAPRGYADHPGSLKTIGVGFTATDDSWPALDAARDLARVHHAEVRAITVVPPPPVMASSPAAPILAAGLRERAVEDARRRLDTLTDVDGRVALGTAAPALRVFATEVDLLVLGSHGRGAIRRLVLGSAADAVLHDLHAPVLVLPQVAGDVEAGTPVEEAAGAR